MKLASETHCYLKPIRIRLEAGYCPPIPETKKKAGSSPPLNG
jgi:hypothetical protein